MFILILTSIKYKMSFTSTLQFVLKNGKTIPAKLWQSPIWTICVEFSLLSFRLAKHLETCVTEKWRVELDPTASSVTDS